MNAFAPMIIRNETQYNDKLTDSLSSWLTCCCANDVKLSNHRNSRRCLCWSKMCEVDTSHRSHVDYTVYKADRAASKLSDECDQELLREISELIHRFFSHTCPTLSPGNSRKFDVRLCRPRCVCWKLASGPMSSFDMLDWCDTALSLEPRRESRFSIK